MNQYYIQNYTKEQISTVLQTIKDCVRENHYVISKNESRQENIDVINEYNLSSKKQKEILIRIDRRTFAIHYRIQIWALSMRYYMFFVLR